MLYIGALYPTIRSVVARYRDPHLRNIYLDVVDYAQHGKDVVRARTSTSQAICVVRPLQKLHSVNLLQSPEHYDPTSTFSLPSLATMAKALDLMNLLDHSRHLLELESSREPLVLDETSPAIALGRNTAPTLWLPHADWTAQYARLGWVNTRRLFRSENPLALSAPTARFEQQLVCHESYIQRHAAPESVLPTREQKQLTGNYKTLFSAENLVITPACYLKAKQVLRSDRAEYSSVGHQIYSLSRRAYTTEAGKGLMEGPS